MRDLVGPERKKRMKIGIDCRAILNPGFGENAGIGHYTYALVEAMLRVAPEHRYVLFFDRNVTEEAARTFVGEGKHVELRFLPFHEYKQYLPIVYSQALLPFFFSREKCDVLFSPTGNVPMAYPGPVVVAAHDLVLFKHPEWFPQKRKAHLASSKTLFWKSMAKARRVIAVSEATKRDLESIGKIPAEKIDVVHEGVTPARLVHLGNGTTCELNQEFCADEVSARFHLPERYVLYLGTVEPRKNVAGLVRAFGEYCRRYPEKCQNLSLAIAGMKGWKYEPVFKEIEKTNDELELLLKRRPIRYLGYVTIEEKWALMRYAACFVFPSFDEGFGLSVLEAMSVGTPVIVGSGGALPEVVGEAGIIVHSDHVEEIMHGMAKVLNDEKTHKHYSERAAKRAEQFSWEKAAKQTLHVLHRAMMNPEK